MKPKQSLFIILITLLIVSMACSLGGGADQEEPEAPVLEATEQEEVVEEPEEVEEPEAAEEPAEAEEAGEAEEAEEAPAPSGGSEEYNTVFPLPDDVQNYMGGDDEYGQINFQTPIPLEDAIAFYRDAFAAMGLTERTINTTITDTGFSMVFDGHENGTIVIQGVALGSDMSNINIRFEDV